MGGSYASESRCHKCLQLRFLYHNICIVKINELELEDLAGIYGNLQEFCT